MENFYGIVGAIMIFLLIAILFLLMVWMTISIAGLIKDEIKDFKKKR